MLNKINNPNKNPQNHPNSAKLQNKPEILLNFLKKINNLLNNSINPPKELKNFHNNKVLIK